MALKQAFIGTDEDLLADTSLKGPIKDESGCTAIAALVTSNNKIYVVSPWNERPRSSFPHTLQANAGDSRSVLSVKGKVRPLSFDHKPTNHCQYLHIYPFMPVLHFAVERARISKAGGFIEDGRVNGM